MPGTDPETERHTIPVADGESVVAVHHPEPRDEGDDWLFCCHGLVSDKSGSYEGRCRRAVAEGYDAVRFDFRGCGEADGDFRDSTLGARIADLRAVVAHFDPASYALFGSSFGARVALDVAATDDRVAAVAGRAPVTFDRTFDEARAVAAEEGTFRYDDEHVLDRGFFADLDSHPFADVATAVDASVAFFHGAEDATVPLRDSLDATAALDTDVMIQTFPGESHLFSDAAEERMRRQLFDWLALS